MCSEEDEKNILLKLNFCSYTTEVPVVCNAEFIRDTPNYYRTNDLQEAFWIELIRNLK